MPELPEVETARRLAEKHVLHRRIDGAAAVRDPIVFDGTTSRRFVAAMRRRTVVATHRRGKHLWFEMDRGPHPMFHFGMTGAFHVYGNESDRPRFWKMELTFGRERLAMTNSRRLGRIRLSADPEQEPFIRRLGFDPLLEMPTAARFREGVAARRISVKALLLDQSFAAGVGNWIADEVLYQARVAPSRRACDLAPQEIERVRRRLRAVVSKAVEVEAQSARFPRTWLFHRRWGKKKDARTARNERIEFETIGGRTSAWVPAVQR